MRAMVTEGVYPPPNQEDTGVVDRDARPFKIKIFRLGRAF